MTALLQDLRYARRILFKSPLFTLAVVATLAIGIGLNTAVFSVIDTLLLRPLPGVRAPEELVQLYRHWPGNQLYGSNSIPHYRDIRDKTAGVYSGVAAWGFVGTSITTGNRAQAAFSLAVSANFFSVLGVPALQGRTFTPDEATGLGAHPEIVLSYNGWKELFGGDPGTVGRSVILDGRQYTIVGITPPDFHGPMPIVTPALFVPMTQINELRPGEGDLTQERGSNSFNVIARLAPGVTAAQARDRMDALVTALRSEYPKDYEDNSITLVPQPEAGLHPTLRNAEVGLSSVVMGVVAILLLIACVNVANLFLSRARDRAREMAVRLSLGARRGVLIRQLLVESSLFSLVSGVAGLAVAWWTMSLVNHISLPMDIDFHPGLSLSPGVLAFTVAITAVTGVLFGLAPALQVTRPSLVPALKGEEAAGQGRSRATRTLVIAQVALSMVLLVAAGLFLRNLSAATAVSKGFNAANLLVGSVDPGIQGYDRVRTDEFYRRLTETLTADPDVMAVGYTTVLPLSLNENDSGVEIPGYTPAKNENMSVQNSSVTPGYFQAMGIPIRAGRAFRAQDDSSAARVLIVNEQFVHRFWPGQNAIGKIVHTHGKDWTVVGVVPTGKYFSLGEPATEFYYTPEAQDWSFAMTIAVRTRGDPTLAIPLLRKAVSTLDPNMPLSDVRTMTDHLGIALLPARVTGWALGGFGVLGLLLASIGIYGVMAYAVSQRTREIGIRMAIGAGTGQVMRLLMRQGLTLILTGIVVGLAGAVLAAIAIRGQLYGGTGFDPLTFVLVPTVFIAVAGLAIWIPAKRASGLDPVRALRQE